MRNLVALPVAAVIVAFSLPALADAPPNTPPTLKFKVLPSASKMPTGDHTVMPYRMEDVIMVTVNDPIKCGQTPQHPSFNIASGKLNLHYDLTPATAGAADCVLSTQFTIHNAPHLDLTVSFSDSNEAPKTASMQNCPGVVPTDDDRWTCLQPAVLKEK